LGSNPDYCTFFAILIGGLGSLSHNEVKATHDFILGEETMHVKVKIGYADGGREKGLNVEVDGPVKLTTDYRNHVVSRSERKMWTEIEASNDAVDTGRKGITMAIRNPTLKQKENSLALQNDIRILN